MYPRESGETFFGDIAGRLILVFSEATGTANAEGHQLNVIEMEDSSSGRGEHRTYAHGMGGVCLYVHVANFAAQRSPQVIKESTFGGTVLGAARTVVAGIEALRTTVVTVVFMTLAFSSSSSEVYIPLAFSSEFRHPFHTL